MKSIAFSLNSKMGLIFLVIGVLASIVLIVWAKLILFLILLLIGCMELFFEYREYEVRPSMTHRGVAISAAVYMAVIAVLWVLMSYMSHVPEVDIARKLFMS